MVLITINIANKNANIEDCINRCLESYKDNTHDDSRQSMDSMGRERRQKFAELDRKRSFADIRNELKGIDPEYFQDLEQIEVDLRAAY